MKKIYTLILFIIVLIPTTIFALEVNSTNYIMYNMDTEKIILESNSSEQISIASLTKIATAIVAIENIDNLDTKITITSETLEGLTEANASVAGFWVGQTLTIEDLLYGLMLPSGADAANALEIYLSEQGLDLISLMNKLVSDLSLTNTNFVNTTGLDDANHYSTVYDVAQILTYALENETFKEIFTTDIYLTSDASITLRASYYSTMSYYSIENEYIIGAKTGYETTAGLCLASISYFDDTNFLLVTAGAPRTTYTNHVVDAMTIYSYVDDNYEYNTLFNTGDIISYIPTEYSTVYQYNVIASESYKIYSESKDGYTYSFEGSTSLNPKSEESVIGFINIYYNDYLIDQIEVTYDGSLEYSLEGFITVNLDTILIASGASIGFLILLIIILKNKKSH